MSNSYTKVFLLIFLSMFTLYPQQKISKPNILTETEPNNTAPQANTISIGDSLTAAISSETDVDYYKITVAAGDTLDIFCSDINGSTLDGELDLFDEAGNMLRYNDDFKDRQHSRIIYNFTTSGTYYFRYIFYANYTIFPNRPRNSEAEKADNKNLKFAIQDINSGEYSIRIKKFTPELAVCDRFNMNNVFENSLQFITNFYPLSANTNVTFEYGTTLDFGSSVPANANPYSGLARSIAYSNHVSGFTPGTAYNIRVRFDNPQGVSYSENWTFPTPAHNSNWAVQNNNDSSYIFRAASFPNKYTGYVVGSYGRIYKTTNSGQTWNSQYYSSSIDLYSVSFCDANTGIAVGAGPAILRTTDGGENWISITMSLAPSYNSVLMFDPNNVIVAANDGTVLKSTNGGTSWAVYNAFPPYVPLSMTFVNSNIGYICGAAGQIAKTTNGGMDWTVLSSGVTTALYGLSFLDENVGYAVGNSNVILKTTDGGANWIPQTAGVIGDFLSVAFSDANTGFITGTNGRILKTTDGGSTWEIENSGTYNALYCITKASANDYVISGENDLVMRAKKEISLISPSGGAVLIAGSHTNITWSTTIFTKNVGISYTTDFGSTWHIFASNIPAAAGSYDWTVPNISTNSLAIRIMDSDDGAVYSNNGGLISIVNGSIAVTSPAGGEVLSPGTGHNIAWNSTGVTNVKLEYSLDGGNNWLLIDPSVPAASSPYAWTVSVFMPATSYAKIRVSDADYPVVNAISNSFIIKNPNPVTELEPNNTFPQAHTLAYGDSVLAAVNPEGDIDYYSFYAMAGDIIDVFAAVRNGSQLDGKISIYDSLGGFLTSNDDYNGVLDSRLEYPITQSGRYYLKYAYYANNTTLMAKSSKEETQVKKMGAPTSTNTGEYYLTFKKFIPGTAVGRLTFHENIWWNSLKVGGLVYPNGLNTTVMVQYSTDLSYSNSVAIEGGAVNGIDFTEIRSVQITGLLPNTRYNFRLMMTNSAGVTYSELYQPMTPQAPVGWSIIDIPPAERFVAAAMVNQTVGYAAQFNGVIRKTTDGGNTWTSQVPGIVSVASMSFIDPLNGYINSSIGELYKTTNGGVNWTAGGITSGLIEDYFSISFANATTGVAATYQGHIYLTTDGGSSWMMIAHPNTNHLRYIKYINSTTAFAVGDNGTIIKTSDGGLIWETKISSTTRNLNSISFFDSMNGIAVGTGGTVIRTTNGGDSWSTAAFPNTHGLYSVSCYGSNQAFVAGEWGELAKTTDGGQNWIEQKSGTNNLLTSVSMFNAGAGILAGNFGYLAKASSSLTLTSPLGGENWVMGSNHNITWSSSGINNVKIEYSVNNGAAWVTQVASVPALSGTYNWTLPNLTASQAKVRISDAENPSLSSESGSFQISGHGAFTEVEPNNTSTLANVIAYGDSVIGSINTAGDVDYFSFTAAAGDTVEVISRHRNSSGLNGLLILYTGAGVLINSSYYYTDYTSARILYVIPTAGTYYIRFSSTSGGNFFPNKAITEGEKENVKLQEKTENVTADIGDYGLVLRKFVPSVPAFGWISLKNTNSNSFRVEGNVYPMGLSTTVSFEYGTSVSYGNTAQATGNPYSATMQSVNAISNLITGLQPSTLYHYRLKAVNSLGTNYSNDLTFTTPAAAGGWAMITSYPDISFTVAKVFDQSKAFVAGQQGYKTTDAGNTWTEATGITTYLYDLSFIDANNGYGVGAAGYIVKTTNGGTSWSVITSDVAADLSSVYFLDINNGFAVGRVNHTFYKTGNGGINWTPVALPNIEKLSKIQMISNTTGFICGSNGSFLKTTDGGLTWTLQTIPGGYYFYDLFARDANNIFIVGQDGKILKTTNGGTAWVTVTSGVTSVLNKICFEDNNNGFIAGNDGTILRTYDGGGSWIKQNSGTLNNISCASLTNDFAIAGGSYGLLLKSVNSITLTSPVGGESWQAGSTHNITWTQTGVSNIKIDYSTNNGTSWSQVSASAPANTGSFSWPLPLTPTSQAKVKLTSVYDNAVTSAGNVFNITSRGTISETEPNNTSATANVITYGDSILASINPDSDVDYYKFYASAGDTIDVFYSSLNGSNYTGKVKLYDSNGMYLWSTEPYNDFGTGVFTGKLPYIITASGYYYLRCAQSGNDNVFPNRKAEAGDINAEFTSTDEQPHEANAAGDYSIRFRKYVAAAPGFIYSSVNPILSLNYNKAILRCFAFTNTLPTTFTFEYGTTASYGNSVSTANGVVPVLHYSICTSSPITGLTGNTTYHFRIKTENAMGVTYTPDRTFTTPITPTNWVILNDPIGGTINAVQVIDANLMYAGKSTGVVKTTDGGNTWVSIPFSSGIPSILSLSFIDANTGYAAGSSGFISKTVNGGALWTNQTSGTVQQIESIHFIDANNGFAAGSAGTILKTTNGGTSWVVLTTGTTTNLNKIRMADLNNIIACGNNGLFLKSTNAGLNWNVQTISGGVHFDDLYSLDASTYIVIGGNLVYKTSNGGTSWTNISPASNTYIGLSFSNQDDGILISNEGKIFRTNNGGASWYQQNSGTANVLNCISYVNNVALIGGSMTEYIKSGSYINIKAPSGGEYWYAGTTYPITWAQSGITNVKVELSTNEGVNWQVISASTPGSACVYNWPVPVMPAVTKCKIRVSDAANAAMFSISQGTFSIYSYASAPALVAPLSNSTGQPTTITFVWRSALNAAKYVLEVAKDPLFANSVVKDTVVADTTHVVSGLLNNTLYYWKVNSLNGAGSSPNSAVWNFTTITAAPQPPVIIAPLNNAVNIPTTTLFLWNRAVGAATYHLQISTDSLFGSFFFRDSTITDTLKIIIGLAPSTVYYYRICGKGAGGTGVWSQVIKFTTIVPSSMIIGTLAYANSAKTPLLGVKVYLSNGVRIIDSTVTAAGGAFSFTNIPNGVYTLSESTTKEWSGVNSTDALLIRRYLSGVGVLDSLQIKCADVNGNGSLNSTDALIIRRRLAGVVDRFTISDWVFENPTLSLAGSAVNLNLRALCAGDVNGSYTPVVAKQKPLFELSNENSLPVVVNKEFEVPVYAAHSSAFGAVTLMLSYPKDLVSLVSVKSKLEGVEYSNTDGLITIVWDDVNSFNIKENDPLLMLKFRGTAKFTDGAKFSLAAEAGSEIADAEGNPIKGLLLKTPFVEAVVPKVINLEQNYPNPFNPSTQINYQIPKQGHVSLKVYDVIGNLVAVLVDGEKEAGNYTVQFNFNSSKVASGVYFYELRFMNNSIVRKMMILK